MTVPNQDNQDQSNQDEGKGNFVDKNQFDELSNQFGRFSEAVTKHLLKSEPRDSGVSNQTATLSNNQPDLSDEEMTQVVIYMANKAGANFSVADKK
jgi:hypothetical protein